MVQNHPVDSLDWKIDFWEEFPSYLYHPIIGKFYNENKSGKSKKNSSKLMWLLSYCYDRKSAVYSNPEKDKWEAGGEFAFNDPLTYDKFFLVDEDTEEKDKQKYVQFPLGMTIQTLIQAFISSISSPLEITLRALEAKVIERTEFITSTKYTLDEYILRNGKSILSKGTADQLDKMFANTEKINTLVINAMNKLNDEKGKEEIKGQGTASLSDNDKQF